MRLYYTLINGVLLTWPFWNDGMRFAWLPGGEALVMSPKG